jgi:dTDP-4-amino-4,6-dideoxygalactose transaminase
VFVDIEPDTYNIDPLAVAEAITSRTRAVLAVHQMGMPCDLNALSLIVSARGIPLIEDAACAAGSQIQFRGEWNHIGRPHGDIACFSFHPRKVITTGEGGMLTAKRGDYDREFRLLRQHGMSVPDTVRHGSERVIFEEYVRLGFNYRMTDVQAAIGRIQIQRLAGLVEQRRKLAALYGALLQDVEGLRLPVEKAWARSNWQSYCVGLPESADQSAVMQTLLDKGIATRRGIMCAHREAPYREQQRRHDLRQSERAQDFSILLPIYAQMTEEQVTYVAEALRDSLLARSASRSISYA